MGRDIAQACSQAGYAVFLVDVDKSILEKGLKLIREGQSQIKEIMGRIKNDNRLRALDQGLSQ